MTDPYLHNREFFGSVSGQYRIGSADTGAIALVPLIPFHTIYIQKLHIEVTTITGSELWTFQDGAGVPIVPSVSAAAIAHFDFDFGPDGVPCTQATSFVLSITGAVGAAGWVTWEAFKKLTLGAAPLVGGAPTDMLSGSGVGTSPMTVAYGRVVGAIAALPSIVSYTVGPVDGTFALQWDVTVSVTGAHSFQVNLAFTDENNVVNNIITLDSIKANGQYATLIANGLGVGVYAGRSITFRAKAGTTITLSTTGTFTTVTYNAEGLITKLA